MLLEGGQATLLDVDHGTYPFVTSLEPDGRRRLRRLAASGRPAIDHGHRRRQGVHDPGRRGPVPDRTATATAASGCARPARVRHHHRPAAPLRLVRRGDRPLRGPGQRRHRLRAHQARRAVRAGQGAGLRRLRRRRHQARRDADDPDRLPPRGAGVRVPRRLVGGHLSKAREFADLPRNAQRVRAGAGGDVGRARSPRSASARAATRPSQLAAGWAGRLAACESSSSAPAAASTRWRRALAADPGVTRPARGAGQPGHRRRSPTVHPRDDARPTSPRSPTWPGRRPDLVVIGPEAPLVAGARRRAARGRDRPASARPPRRHDRGLEVLRQGGDDRGRRTDRRPATRAAPPPRSRRRWTSSARRTW